MKAIETTAVFEGSDHLRLTQHIAPTSGEVRIIVLIPQEDEISKTNKAPDFYAAIGSQYRDFPHEPIRTADEWLDELREGESL